MITYPNTGLGLASEGKEHTIEELGDYDKSKIKTVSLQPPRKPKILTANTNQYPLAWVNPITGEKAFQVHGICARKLFLRNSPDEQPRVIEDIEAIRAFIADIQLRILKPQYVCMAPVEEGEVAMWDNYGVFHSAVEYPLEGHGPRTMHQANIGASGGPVGPVPIPVY
jgi:alpha-ketoglutarate-dependent taurine dioxygenase